MYITVFQSPMHHQLTFEEFMYGTAHKQYLISNNETNTRTYRVDDLERSRFDGMYSVHRLIRIMKEFNDKYAELRAVEDRHSLYYQFFIPKKSQSGGKRKWREINAPLTPLMNALNEMKSIIETEFGSRTALYHTSAFAYIKQRSTLKAVKRHQSNESKWFAKYDFSNFFGSTTKPFVMSMLEQIYPFSEVIRALGGRELMEDFIDLAFLDGVLPQGTPISPMLTNIMMIPIDFCLYNKFRNFNGKYFVYTRYADDIIISCKYDFSFRQIEQEIRNVLSEHGAPFTIKPEKTRYGSTAGSNWNLGVILNKDNKITIGRKRKREFISSLSNYAMDKKNGIPWEKYDVQVLEGLRNYYRMVEEETIDGLVKHLSEKFKLDIVSEMKADIKAKS